MESIVLLLMSLFYPLVVVVAGLAWVETRSGWSFMILLALFVRMQYRGGDEIRDRLVIAMKRSAESLSTFRDHSPAWNSRQILLDALNDVGENGVEAEHENQDESDGE